MKKTINIDLKGKKFCTGCSELNQTRYGACERYCRALDEERYYNSTRCKRLPECIKEHG